MTDKFKVIASVTIVCLAVALVSAGFYFNAALTQMKADTDSLQQDLTIARTDLAELDSQFSGLLNETQALRQLLEDALGSFR